MANEFDEMLERATSELSLPAQDLARVVAELRKDKPVIYPGTLLRILGKGGDKSYKDLVEPFLETPNDPMIARAALWTLCVEWNLTSHFIPRLRNFVQGVSWDIGEDLRLAAFSIVGEYLRNNSDAELLRKLLAIFEDHTERQLIREAAYHALGRAVGRDYVELPPVSRPFDLVKDVDPTILHEVRQQLE